MLKRHNISAMQLVRARGLLRAFANELLTTPGALQVRISYVGERPTQEQLSKLAVVLANFESSAYHSLLDKYQKLLVEGGTKC